MPSTLYEFRCPTSLANVCVTVAVVWSKVWADTLYPCGTSSSVELPDGANLDRAPVRAGDARSHLDGLLGAVGFDLVVRGQLLLRDVRRPAARLGLAVSDPHVRGRVGGEERVAVHVVPAALDRLREYLVRVAH